MQQIYQKREEKNSWVYQVISKLKLDWTVTVFNPRRLTKILCSGNDPGLSYKNWFLFWVLLLGNDVFFRGKCRRKEGKVSGPKQKEKSTRVKLSDGQEPSWHLHLWFHIGPTMVHLCVLSHFRCVWVFAAPWTVAPQAPLSTGFSRQQHWSGLPCPPAGDLPESGVKPESLTSPSLAGRFLTSSATWLTDAGKGAITSDWRAEQLPELPHGSEPSLNSLLGFKGVSREVCALEVG